MINKGQLKNIKINGFKSIKTLDLNLKELNIIIGANGSGKSNFIDFFKFIKSIANKDIQTYISVIGANKILHFGKKYTDKINFSLYFPPNQYGASLIPENNRDGLIFKSEKTKYAPENANDKFKPKIKQLANRGDFESKLNYDTSIDRYILNYIKDWKLYHFHDTSTNAKIKSICNINDGDYLKEDGSNLPAFLKKIKNINLKSYSSIIKTIQRVAPFFQDFILNPEPRNPDNIRLKWEHKGTDEYFGANDLSDGTLRFICLVTLLLQPKLPTTILLDEPELGIHPSALVLLASIFKVVSAKTQLIISTQSVTLLNEFNSEDIIVVDRIDNCSIFKRLDKDDFSDWLDEYKIGEIWQKNLINGNINS